MENYWLTVMESVEGSEIYFTLPIEKRKLKNVTLNVDQDNIHTKIDNIINKN